MELGAHSDDLRGPGHGVISSELTAPKKVAVAWYKPRPHCLGLNLILFHHGGRSNYKKVFQVGRKHFVPGWTVQPGPWMDRLTT